MPASFTSHVEPRGSAGDGELFHPECVDPIGREPETADASGAQPWDIDLFYDLSCNLFVTPRRVPANIRAQNLNTIDEVPDSGWFTNCIGTHDIGVETVVRGHR